MCASVAPGISTVGAPRVTVSSTTSEAAGAAAGAASTPAHPSADWRAKRRFGSPGALSQLVAQTLRAVLLDRVGQAVEEDRRAVLATGLEIMGAETQCDLDLQSGEGREPVQRLGEVIAEVPFRTG